MKVICENLEFSREGFTLLADAEFGEGTHIVTGRIGSGKSTLASLLAGTEKPISGGIKKEGISSKILSMQFPEYHLTHTTIGGEIRSWGLEPASVLREAELSYPEKNDPMKLSRGELKRLHLSCILQKGYDLMVLDEPFSSLDCIWKEKFRRRMNEESDGIRIIFTHERRFLPECRSRWNMAGGKLARTE